MCFIGCLDKGCCLVNVVRICDMIKLDFLTTEGETVCLHVQTTIFRGLKHNKLLISSRDIYVPSIRYKKKKFRRFKWDIPGNSLFDDQMLDFKKEFLSKKVEGVNVVGKDLILDFGEGLVIELLSCTLEKDRELYRVFKKGDLASHIVVEV